MKKKSLVSILSGIVICIGIAIFFIKQNLLHKDGINMYQQRLRNVALGLELYREHFGEYPQGDEVKIAEQLTGQNRDNKVMIELSEPFIREGKITDFIGTPLRIKCNDAIGVLIHSAGDDKIFETKDDDIYSHPYKPLAPAPQNP